MAPSEAWLGVDGEDDVADLVDTMSDRGEWGGYGNGDGELAVASAMVRSGRGRERAREGAIPMGLGVAWRHERHPGERGGSQAGRRWLARAGALRPGARPPGRGRRRQGGARWVGLANWAGQVGFGG